MNRGNWIPEVLQRCDEYSQAHNEIGELRKKDLKIISDYIGECQSQGRSAQLTVICTHNSRRSHFGQIWMQVASAYYGYDFNTYSGGTEATAFHPNAVEAIERLGFEVERSSGENPRYQIRYSDDSIPITCFSKKFDYSDNPHDQFGAIMVCNDAAEACPFVPGAEKRFVLPYDDPKEFDGTDIESEKYNERCRQIGLEMFYIVKNIS